MLITKRVIASLDCASCHSICMRTRRLPSEIVSMRNYRRLKTSGRLSLANVNNSTVWARAPLSILKIITLKNIKICY